MSRFVSAFLSIAAALAFAGAAFAQGAPTPPDLQSSDIAWIAMNNDLGQPATGLGPTKPDPGHPYIPNGRGAQPTFRIGDTSNPNLKPWAVERMKKDNAEVLAGKIAFTARSSFFLHRRAGLFHPVAEGNPDGLCGKSGSPACLYGCAAFEESQTVMVR